MTRQTRSISILADTRRRTAAVAVTLAALALLGAVAAAGTATAQSEQPTVVVTDGTTAADGTTTVGVVLTDAPDGLSGYYLELTVENPDVARVESAGYPDAFGLTSEPQIGSDGATATLEAADVEGAVDPGATDVTLATVTVRGGAPGDVALAVEPRQFDADDGSAFSPATQSGTVTVAGSGGGDAPAADGSTDTDSEAGGDAPGDDSAGSDTQAGDDGGSTGGSDGDTESTSGAGPLSPILTLLALLVLAAAGLRRRR
jgi:MYXO-CTERM domain-containing protein